jgi:hypothetical protein
VTVKQDEERMGIFALPEYIAVSCGRNRRNMQVVILLLLVFAGWGPFTGLRGA